MKEEMKELYTEGLASRGGPESCAGGRKDVSEALTGVRAGRPLSHEINQGRGADTVVWSGRQHRLAAIARVASGPRGVEEPCMHGTFMRENREIPSSPAAHGQGDGPLREG